MTHHFAVKTSIQAEINQFGTLQLLLKK